MKTYKVSWIKGRLSGAKGICYPDSVIVQAHNPAAARLKAYDTGWQRQRKSVTA